MKTYEDKINSGNVSNEKKATCKHCGQTIQPENGIIQESLKKNYYFICVECNNKHYNYTTTNNKKNNSPKKHNITVSYEFESMTRDNRLYDYGFLPTSDQTVAIEWKTPIYQSLNGLSKIFKSIDDLGLIYNSEAVGCHSNTGFVNGFSNSQYQLLKDFYIIMFQDLSDHLKNNPDKSTKLFGRPLNRWCEPITINSNVLSHYNYINISHRTHLENRVTKFINYRQFMQATKFNIDCLKCIQKNLFLNYDKGFSREKLEKKAHVISRKLVKLFNKHYDILVEKEGI